MARWVWYDGALRRFGRAHPTTRMKARPNASFALRRTRQVLVVGLMSGTSLDGIDACLVEIHGAGEQLRHELVAHRLHAWPPGLRHELINQLDPEQARLPELAALHMRLGEAFAQAVVALVQEAEVPMDRIDLIASHGQTIWHDPSAEVPVTWQLGEAAVIAARTGVTVVSDFRPMDVALGGQGAPLVPYADFLLFGHGPKPMAIQNMGGIGNVTYLPGRGRLEGFTAFDTGPGNMVIDGLMTLITGGQLGYDPEGRFASAGKVDEAWVAELLAEDPYLSKYPPKSTGRERYGTPFAAKMLVAGRKKGLSDSDIVACATRWTALTVADAFRRFLPSKASPMEVLISGGGVLNPALMRALGSALAPLPVRSVAEVGIDPVAKEAVAFAILGYQAFHGQHNVLPAATGATAPAVLGRIVPGKNFSRALLKAQSGGGRLPATEMAQPASQGWDGLGTEAMVAVMHQQDFQAVQAVGQNSAAIAQAVDAIAKRLAEGGRLIYLGAGTSGRLGVLDASECPPTFAVDAGMVVGLIAGGDTALRQAVEGAEDNEELGASDLKALGLNAKDFVVGISASGSAPYVRGALHAAAAAGAGTALICCVRPDPRSLSPQHLIVLPTGAEVLAGSTRLKAGTATKLVLNMLSTLAMVRLGKVHDNLMVDVVPTNRKLRARAVRLVQQLAEVPHQALAEQLLAKADGRVKTAVVMGLLKMERLDAEARLADAKGVLRAALAKQAPEKVGET